MVFLLILTLPSTALASDWQMFKKDVFNTGVTDDPAPVSTPDSNSWAYNLGDEGVNSFPVIVGDMAYIASSSGVSAIYLENGTEAWKGSCSLGYALSTPAYGDGQVFAASTSGKLYIFDAKTGAARNITVSSNMLHGPILYENHRLYFGDSRTYTGYDGNFYCYPDNGSSTYIWTRPAENGRAYYRVNAAIIGDYVVYGDNGGNLTSVRKADGFPVEDISLFELFGKDLGEIWTGITYDEETQRLYTSTKKGSDEGYCLYVGFDPATGTFSKSEIGEYSSGYSTSTPSIYGDRVYVGTGGLSSGAADQLLCLNRTSLEKIWAYPSSGSVESSPTLSTYYDDGDGTVDIYFTTNSATGSLYHLRDNATGTEPKDIFVYNGSHATYCIGGAAISNGWAVWGYNAGDGGAYVIGATTAEALEAAANSTPSGLEVLWDGEISPTPGTFSLVPDNNLSASYEIDNFTDLGVLVAVANKEGFELNISDTWYVAYGSFYLNSINGIGDEDHWWNLYINDVSATAGLGGNQLEDGDKVSLYYVSMSGSGGPEEAEYVLNITLNANESPNNAEWTQFHKDVGHTGFAPGEAPDTNNLLWVSEPIWATPSSSPVIADGKVFVKCAVDHVPNPMSTTPEQLRVVALDEFTGDIISSNEIGLILPTWGSLCYDNGQIWYGQDEAINGGSMIADGKVFDSNGESHHYFCTDAESGEEIWNFTVTECGKATPAYWDGKVVFTSGPVFGAGDGYVYCVDADSGNEIWNLTLTLRPLAGSPAISNGVIYLTTFNGEVLALDIDNEGDILWNQTFQEDPAQGGTSSTPAIAYGNVYVSEGYPGSARTFCFNATNGEPIWNTTEEEDIGGWTSSVAVADNKVFIGKPAEGDWFGHNDTYALDAYTGEVIWSAPYGGSSPAISDGIVFTIGFDGRVYAFADPDPSSGSGISLETIFNGTVNLEEGKFTYSPAANPSAEYEWDRMTDLGALIATGIEFETDDLNYGSFWITSLNGIENEDFSLPNASSWSVFVNDESAPAGLGGNALSDGDKVSFYYLPWDGMTPLVDQATYAVHITVNAVPSDNWYQFHKDAANTGFSPGDAPENNSLLWVSDPIGAVTSSSPVIAEGKVFVNCGGGSCCADDSPEASSKGAKVVALDEFTGDSLFTCGNGSDRYGSWASPCYDDGKIWCGLPESVNGGTTVANAKVYVGNYDGHKYFCFDEETNEELWNFEVAGYAQGTPAFSDGKTFLTSGTYSPEGHVYCVDADSGTEIWNVTLPQDALGSPAVSNGIVYLTTFIFGSGEGYGSLYALYANNGSPVWDEPAVIQATDSTPAIGYGNVYVASGCPGSNPIQTYCFNSTTGSPVWNTSVEDDLGGWTVSVAVADQKVFVGKCDEADLYGHHGLYALNAATGETVWSTPYGGSSPAISDGIVFTIGADGRVYAFADPTELDIDYSVPETGMSLDAEVLPAVSIEFNRSVLDFGTLSLDESSSVHLSVTNSGISDVTVSAELGAGSSALYEGHLFFGATPWDQYSKLISSQSTEDVEVVLNPVGYSGDLGEAEGNLIFWIETA